MGYTPGGCKVTPTPSRTATGVKVTPSNTEMTQRRTGSIKSEGDRLTEWGTVTAPSSGDWSTVTTRGDKRGADHQTVTPGGPPVPPREAESWESTTGYGS